mgnify:CR=1 FL=1
MERQGSTIALVAMNNMIVSIISMTDTIKTDARQTIRELRRRRPNLRIMMMKKSSKLFLYLFMLVCV